MLQKKLIRNGGNFGNKKVNLKKQGDGIDGKSTDKTGRILSDRKNDDKNRRRKSNLEKADTGDNFKVGRAYNSKIKILSTAKS